MFNYVRHKNIDNSREQRIQILQKLMEGIPTSKIASDCKINIYALLGIKHTIDQINLLKKTYRKTAYTIISDYMHNWLLERIVLRDTISDALFSDQVYEFARKFVGSSTEREKENMLHEFKKCYKNLIQSDSQSVPESSQNFERNEKNVDKFIREFIQRLKQENISEDNIYTMIEKNFKLKHHFRNHRIRSKSKLSDKDKEKAAVIEKLKNDSLTFIFCTNATGSHKLLPFHAYNYKHEIALKYLKNTSFLIMSQRDTLNNIFTNWYNNHFIKSVREHRQKTNVSGKTFLLIKKCEFSLEENTKDDSFKILFFPKNTFQILQPLDERFTNKLNNNFRHAFKDFYKSYNIENLIKVTCKPWTDLTSACIKDLWRKFFKSDFQIKENNITKEDIADTKNILETLSFIEEVKTEKRQKQQKNIVNAENIEHIENTESIEENIKEENNSAENLPMNNLTVNNVLQGPDEKSEASIFYVKTEVERRQQEEQQEDTKSIAEETQRENIPMEILEIKTEGEEHEEQLENTKSIENTQSRNIPEILKMMYDLEEKNISPQNLTTYFNSYGKAEGEKYQEQLENINSIEDTQNRNIPEILKMMHDIEDKNISPQNLAKYLNSF
ncbi:uncharacterized protein LOC114942057 [Nylanderia fulva]|uniref:uncharacterized protein LOC114942057 n=1 Tax=Nylanderia fulva TaxID=613905 RepID=UPI0010FAD290|nr:uncharacterized protein LOC114942057 [Nylanderia fulva]